MRGVALAASMIIALQILVSLITGSSICPDAGCKVVEGLTIIPPLYLNILGLIFFQMIFWLLFNLKPKFLYDIDLIGLVLVLGLAFDSALFVYQIFVAHSFCSYCLIIFAIVIALNLLYGARQTAVGAAIVSALVIAFAVMSFFPGGAGSKTVSLKNAAYGKKSCSAPTKEIYLIFSADCPHCQTVIETLNNCNSCDLYLNPIDTITQLNLDGLELNQGFSPQINRLILKVLAIDSVPVLMVKDDESYRFIRGESKILTFVRRACFTHDEVLYFGQSPDSADKEITLITDEDEECSVEIDCGPNQTPSNW